MTVQLFHNGLLVTQKWYKVNSQKKKIIESWKKLYGKNFCKAEIKTTNN